MKSKKKNKEIEDILKDDADYKLSEVKKQHSSMIKRISSSLNQVSKKCSDQTSHIERMLESLCKSEQYISKAIKTIKQQDEAHESTVRFYKDSEKIMKSYYNQKLKLCLEQIKLRDKPNVRTQEIQTDQVDDEITEELLIENTHLKATQNVKEKYQKLYYESVEELNGALQHCTNLENKLRKIKK